MDYVDIDVKHRPFVALTYPMTRTLRCRTNPRVGRGVPCAKRPRQPGHVHTNERPQAVRGWGLRRRARGDVLPHAAKQNFVQPAARCNLQAQMRTVSAPSRSLSRSACCSPGGDCTFSMDIHTRNERTVVDGARGRIRIHLALSLGAVFLFFFFLLRESP